MTKKQKRRHRSEWLNLIMKFKTSKMSCKEFCYQEGISKTSFYKWQDILHDELAKDVERISEDFIPLDVISTSEVSEMDPAQSSDHPDSQEQSSSPFRPALSSISSSFKLSKSDLAIEFASGCSLAEFDAVIAIFRGDHAAK